LSTIILWYLKKSNIRDFIVVFIVCFFFQLYTKGILRFCLQGLLGEKQRASLFQFLRLLEILFLPVFDRETEGDFINKWHQALACIERDFPSSLQTYVFHLLHHLKRIFHNILVLIYIWKLNQTVLELDFRFYIYTHICQ
jgi:hypothetical protein